MDNFGFDASVNNYTGGLTYLGTWDALNNVPFLQSSVGIGGTYYIVSVSGTTNLNGITDWQVGDWAIFIDGGTNQWQKIDNHDIQAYTTVQSQTINLPQRSIIDFQGSGVNAIDNGVKTIVNIAAPTTYGLYAQTALGTIIKATIVETSLIGTGVGTLTVPANAFFVGDSFIIKMCGYLSCANAETIHIRIKSNGIIIIDTGVFQMKACTNKYFELLLDFTITKLGVSGTAELFANGQYSYNQNANANIEGINFASIDNTLFNTTITNILDITAEWGSSNINNSIQSQNFVLTKVY
jgi:hypothetical protein